MRLLRIPLSLAFTFVVLAISAASGSAQVPGPCCLLPDNGSGTAALPPNCSVGYNGQGDITDGLPPGSPILLTAKLHSFTGVVAIPGGSLGGEQETWSATLDLTLQGTGVFAAYNRFIALPVSGQTHSAPRTAFQPVQSFSTLLNLLQGQIAGPGDPDFDLLRITGGNGFGLPSPGHTILTSQSGSWAVDSFFDITFRVDFIGTPAGPFGGMSGSTTNVLEHFTMCHEQPTPTAPASWGAMKALYR
jgi:hypothetical protein